MPETLAPAPSSQNTSQQARPRINFTSIDILRGLAAMAVVLFHAQGFFYRGLEGMAYQDQMAHGQLTTFILVRNIVSGVLSHGWIGVPLFFVISGFCIHLPHAIQGSLDRREFIVRRLLRIWPPYVVGVLVGALIEVVKAKHVSASLTVQVAEHLVFWVWGHHPLTTYDQLLLNPVIWSLVFEVQCYAVYWLIWPIVRRFGVNWLCLLFCACEIVLQLALPWLKIHLGHPLPDMFNQGQFLFARLGEWWLGAWIAQRVAQYYSIGIPIVRRPVAVLAFGVVSLIAIRVLAMILDPFPWPEGLCTAGCFAAILIAWIALELQRNIDRSAEPQHPLIVIGHRSYSLYLLHFPLLAIVGEIGMRLMHRPTSDKLMMGGTWTWLGWTLIGLVVVAIATEITYRFVERPSHHLARIVARKVRRSDAAVKPAA